MREYELEVLEQYDIEVMSTRKIRGAFFCETNEGTMVLKEAAVSERRALLLYTLLCHLESEGYPNVDIPVLNREKGLVSTFRGQSKYMLKKWYIGRECDVRRETDVLEACRNLARLHKMMRWPETALDLPENAPRQQETAPHSSEAVSHQPGTALHQSENTLCPPVGRHLKQEFLCHNRELKKVRNYIRNKVNKGEFEYLFLKYFENMYQLAAKVTKRLEGSEYEKLYQDSLSEGLLVHGDYNYHNVLMLPENGGAATTNFDHFRIDVQALDLYYFLRKVMEKHKWKESLGRAMLETYAEVRPLKPEELEVIALKTAYPEKFWKTANTYYHSNKAWIPEKSVEKLQTAVLQTEEKIQFLQKIFTFFL